MIKESVGCQDQIANRISGLKRSIFSNRYFSQSIIDIIHIQRIFLIAQHNLNLYVRLQLALMKQHVSNISQGKSEELFARAINQISENAQQLLKTEEDIEKLGKLLNDSSIKRDFTPNVSNQHFNQIYEIAMKNGAVYINGCWWRCFLILSASSETCQNQKS